MLDSHAGPTEPPGHDIEHVVGERVADVRGVVRGDAADVEAGAPGARLEGHDRLTRGVVDAQRHRGLLRTLQGAGGEQSPRLAQRCVRVSKADALHRFIEAQPLGLGNLRRVGMQRRTSRGADQVVVHALEDQAAAVATPVHVLGVAGPITPDGFRVNEF